MPMEAMGSVFGGKHSLRNTFFIVVLGDANPAVLIASCVCGRVTFELIPQFTNLVVL